MEVAILTHGAQISGASRQNLSRTQETSRLRELVSGHFLAPLETMG
jgi:hypothetical protein